MLIGTHTVFLPTKSRIYVYFTIVVAASLFYAYSFFIPFCSEISSMDETARRRTAIPNSSNFYLQK